MLNTPAPYPEVGSWALFERRGQQVPARIVADRAGKVVISFPDVPSASGNIAVPLDQLLDPTPLTEAERAELLDLSQYLAGLAQPEKSAKAPRFEALQLRQIRARSIVDQLQRLNRTRLGTPATREAFQLFSAAIDAIQQRKAA